MPDLPDTPSANPGQPGTMPAPPGLRHFAPLFQQLAQAPPLTVAVAGDADDAVMAALAQAQRFFPLRVWLAGLRQDLARRAEACGLDLRTATVVDVSDPSLALDAAIQAVRSGQAQALLKGMIPTAALMRAVLNPETGLRGPGLLSHLAVFDIPGFDRLIFVTDGGINIAPALPEKLAILRNAVPVARRLLGRDPRVAVLAAVEVVNPAMPATLDAAALAKMAQRGQIEGATVEGPLALDGAISWHAAQHKGTAGSVAGDADILLAPDIEVGNTLGKAITHFAGGVMAGIVLGARAPIVLTSRSDSALSKLASLAVAMACGELLGPGLIPGRPGPSEGAVGRKGACDV